jgi:dipeptide transport system substrate-binding protein
VKAKIVTYEWAEYLDRSKKGEHQTVLLGWTGDNGDPDNFLNQLLGCDAAKSGGNRARWCDKSFDQLIIDAKRTSDVAKRTELYKKAQAVFKEEAPWVTIAHSVVYMPMRKNVAGYIMDPLGTHQFYSVDIQ